jgi:hypothetical protein
METQDAPETATTRAATTTPTGLLDDQPRAWTKEMLDAAPVGQQVVDDDSDTWTKNEDGWRFSRAAYTSTEMLARFGPFYDAPTADLHDEPAVTL